MIKVIEQDPRQVERRRVWQQERTERQSLLEDYIHWDITDKFRRASSVKGGYLFLSDRDTLPGKHRGLSISPYKDIITVSHPEYLSTAIKLADEYNNIPDPDFKFVVQKDYPE
jgi:hypothetical protein|tara:strand:+ start:321 stop:659 length:339 start_codon:yes stop_codon:yes gene_type:complete